MEPVARGAGTLDSRVFGFVWNSGILAAAPPQGGVLIACRCLPRQPPPDYAEPGCLQAAMRYVLPGPVAALAVLVLLQTAPVF